MPLFSKTIARNPYFSAIFDYCMEVFNIIVLMFRFAIRFVWLHVYITGM